MINITVISLINDPNYAKCPRCKIYTKEGLNHFDGLCNKCIYVLVNDYPDHESIPFIRDYAGSAVGQ